MSKQKKFAVLEKDYYKFTRNGVRNGYIGMPKSNKMYGVMWDEKSPLLEIKENHKFNGNYLGLLSFLLDTNDKCLNPSMYFSAHCGFTYSDFIKMNGEYNEKKDLWYFGFDCNHAGDKEDWQKAYEYGLIAKELLDDRTKWDLEHPILDEEHRTLEYVEDCLNTLADELAEFEIK